MRALALCCDTLLGSTSAKRSVKKTGTTEVRRLLRNVRDLRNLTALTLQLTSPFYDQNSKLLPKIMQYLATSSDIKPPATAAPLLGLSLDVSLRLRPRKGQAASTGKDWVSAAKDPVLKYYRDHIIAAREALPLHVLVCLAHLKPVRMWLSS